jgi:hypothetical protein
VCDENQLRFASTFLKGLFDADGGMHKKRSKRDYASLIPTPISLVFDMEEEVIYTWTNPKRVLN